MLLKLFLCLLGVGLCASQKEVNIESRIINGKDGNKCEFPWMAFIKNYGQNIGCGGFMIDNTHIMTAAHCVVVTNKTSKVSSAEPSANLYVYVGSSDLGKMTKFLVKTVTPHEMYNFITTENDIAILTLASPITFNDCTKPIPLVNATTKLLDEDCKVMGWGATTDSEKDAGPSTLKYATVFIHNEYKCQDLFRNKLPNLPSSIFCAKGRGGSDVCRGDSGGPLVCKKYTAKEYFVHGIVSSNLGCNSQTGFYMKVAFFIPWIQSKIAK